MRTRITGLIALLTLALTATASAWGAGPPHNFAGQIDAVFGDAVRASLPPPPPTRHHGGPGGHLPASNANVDLVSRLQVSGVVPDEVTDVATYRDTAYLGNWGVPNCPGGFWVVDIRNPSRPRELTFVTAPDPDTYQTEGMHALRLTTPTFRGDVLVVSNETCTGSGPLGGISIYDVSNPAAPVLLSAGRGDTDGSPGESHDSHSAFAWDAGDKAYAVMVDNDEGTASDVDIMDITDPRNPTLIKETGLDDWPEAQDNLAFGDQANLHDMVVRRAEGHWLMLLSYWDAGYVVLNVDDPANPRYLRDSDFGSTDPLGLRNNNPPEGNAHEAEFDRCPEEGVRSRFPCGNVRYIVAADEDFGPYRTGDFRITTGAHAGVYASVGVSGAASPAVLPDRRLNGPTVYGGYACPDPDGAGPLQGSPPVPQRSSVPLVLAPGEEAILVVQRGPGGTPSQPFDPANPPNDPGGCFPGEKAEQAVNAGWDAVLFVNRHTPPPQADNPPFCGSGAFTSVVVGVCTTHEAFHRLFNTTPDYSIPYDPEPNTEPDIGARGDKIEVAALFDGWGYMHLIDADTMQHLDSFAIPEAIDERYAQGFGVLSVHEVTTDPTGDVGYVAWYAGGFRVVDYSGGDLREVGHYIAPEGNEFWGVELNVRKDGRLFALASDTAYGLYIFRFGTDLQVGSTDARASVGRPLNVRSTVRNDGTIAETNAKWSMRLPRGVRLLSAFSSQGRCSVSGRQVNCFLGRIAEDGRAGIALRLVSSRAGTFRPETLVNGRKAEYDVGNNSDRISLRVRAAAGAAGAGAGGALTGRP
jgi:hypothetical protein